MKRILCYSLALLLSLLLQVPCGTLSSLRAQEPLENKAFQAGENLEYQLYFNWKFIWIKAGIANLNISEKKYDGKQAFRCHLITTGSKRTDRFFMMRDTLVSYLTPQLVPLYYRKGALEGKRYTVDEIWYSYPKPKRAELKQRYINHRGEISEGVNTPEHYAYDMLSMLLRARSFDATQFQEGQHLQFYMAEGDEVKSGTLVYRGKKKFKMEDTGIVYRCLVFSFVEYEKKKEKEVITFYITDDDNHMPVRLDLYLKFGIAKAFLKKADNLRNPQTSIIP